MIIGNTLQTTLDLPLWFKADLDASKKVQYYTTPGLNNISSISQSLTIDKTAQYTVDEIHLAVMRKVGEPASWDASSLDLVAEMVRTTWFNFLKNGREYVWSAPAALFLPTPAALVPAVDTVETSRMVMSKYTLQVPIIIPGGQAINITQEWERAFDFTGLTCQLTLLGILDREIART